MAATMPPFSMSDSTLNISTLRAPLASSHAPSMADTLPATVDFGFEDLRAHMSAFTQRFDEFIERGRKRVLEERNDYCGRVGKINDQHEQTHASIAQLRSQTTHHSSLLASQSAETSEMHTAIASLTLQRDTHASNNTQLQSRVKAQKVALARLKSAQRDRNEFVSQQRGLDGEELKTWEEGLGLGIEGTGEEERVRFVFWAEAGKRDELGRFELDMREGGWKVVGAKPKVDAGSAGREKVEESCRAMSEGEELGVFLKGMRGLFLHMKGTR